jgi:hypothetical protein
LDESAATITVVPVSVAAPKQRISRTLEGRMFNWVTRGLWFVAGIITGWFIASDAVNFGVIQMVVALLLLTLIVAIIAFWPNRWKIGSEHSRKQQP